MPLYRNPDFQRLPNGLSSLFDTAADGSFFALPAWFDLMARRGVPAGTEIRLYTDEQPSPATALVVQTAVGRPGRGHCGRYEKTEQGEAEAAVHGGRPVGTRAGR